MNLHPFGICFTGFLILILIDVTDVTIHLELQPPPSSFIMNPPSSTQLAPISPNTAPLSYQLLDGDWPILDPFPPVPEHVIARIATDASGSAILNNLQYLSLGLFLIDTNLLQPHPTQRPLDQSHVSQLREDFERLGIHRMESPGVVIGLGEGWLQMKNPGPQLYRISNMSPHKHLLATQPEGPIAEIIRGGHRTEAIRVHSTQPDSSDPQQDFWLYNVLAPGSSSFFFFFFFVDLLICSSSCKHPSLRPSPRLFLHRQPSQKGLAKLLPPHLP